jgi:bifunctional UDP-N-acetylglucosamine pyrophosphorylase/glucosamine-1-phosphate N-acetyltransferase
MQIAIVILAAGKGTRLKSKRAKVLHEIGGKALLQHVVDAAKQVVPPHDIYAVIGHQAEAVEAALKPSGIRFVQQDEQLGTGHAVQCAERATRGYEHVIVLSGDVPLLKPETIIALRDFHIEKRAAMTILSAHLQRPEGYGRIVRKSAHSAEVTAIIEQKSLTARQHSIHEINTGIYAFRRDPLFESIVLLRNENPHKELYLTDMAGIFTHSGKHVVALEALDPVEVLGANTIPEMMELDRAMRMETARRFMLNGVIIQRPDTVVLDSTVEIGPDTVIEPYVQLLGATKIGSDCRIRSYSVIENAKICDHVTIRQNCVIADSQINPKAVLGPFAHVRPGCLIGEGAHIGNFVETKQVRMGKGSKANHLTYLGDAEIGAGVNIGAGTITCNYDGQLKHRTLIGDGVFVGSDSTLIAPLVIGNGAYVAAASCITEDVPEDALALGRPKQTLKPDWAKRRRAQMSSRKSSS